jgi:hypothetical protein
VNTGLRAVCGPWKVKGKSPAFFFRLTCTALFTNPHSWLSVWSDVFVGVKRRELNQ